MNFIRKNVHYVVIAVLSCVVFCFIFSTIYMRKIIKQQNITIAKQNELIQEKDAAIKKYKKEEEATKERVHRIDQEVQKCMKKENYTTYGMSYCSDKGGEAWFKEIDKYLELLKKELPKDKYKLIENSQQKWSQYQKAEFLAINKIILELDGTIHINIASGHRNGIIKLRALDLETYYRNYTRQYPY